VNFPLDLLVAKWGPTGLVSLGVLLIIFGRLVPIIFYNDMRKQRDEWKKTAEEALKQNSVLLESNRVADATFKALKRVAQGETEIT